MLFKHNLGIYCINLSLYTLIEPQSIAFQWVYLCILTSVLVHKVSFQLNIFYLHNPVKDRHILVRGKLMNDTSWKGSSLAGLVKNSPLSDLKVKKKNLIYTCERYKVTALGKLCWQHLESWCVPGRRLNKNMNWNTVPTFVVHAGSSYL